MPQNKLPELLAPAGDTSCFLAALAAGADAVYLGLKNFSARAGAENFSTTELARMVGLAEQEGRRIYVAFNSLLKGKELSQAGRLIKRLQRDAHPHGMIIQDLGLANIARQAGFEGELHLSTLSNTACMHDISAALKLGVSRIVIPRELSIDEIRALDEQAPENVDFEMFVHGALCWCVSGRCYWSSYLGGKSGLRGRCVQPCRRIYTQKSREGRFFSCQDLSIDALVKTLAGIPHVRSLKIEGRKKGPHYVYHVVAAYRMLLDSLGTEEWSAAKKEAGELLEMALGRPTTRARFLPQKDCHVSTPEEPTSSGMLVGKIQFEKKPGGGSLPFIKPRVELLPKDLLRIGYEDEPWHDTIPVVRRTPKAGSYFMRLARHKMPKTGVPVFLIDRREPGLITTLHDWQHRLDSFHAVESPAVEWEPSLPPPVRARRSQDYHVMSSLPQGRQTRGSRSIMTALWMSTNTVRAVSRTVMPRISWWLPPVIWPEEEAMWDRLVREAMRDGAENFVLNAPWQTAYFEDSRRAGARLTAGPFCNISNPAAVAVLEKMGFEAAFVSTELSEEDYLELPRKSCLPLGMVLSGFWPVGISRHGMTQARANEPFFSPKGETFWGRNYGRNLWIYPAWPMDLSAHRQELEGAGYAFFARIDENLPPDMPPVRRTSTFNWNNNLL